MRKKAKEYWAKNVTDSDLIISDLALKIPANRTVNLYRLNPRLKPAIIEESEEEGALGKCLTLRKVLKLPCAPIVTEQDLPTEIKEATRSLPSRSKSANIVDVKELDFIEELSDAFSDDTAQMYEDMEDGLADPMIESVPLNSEGIETATVINPGSETIREAPHISDVVHAEPQQVGTGSSRYFTVRTLK